MWSNTKKRGMKQFLKFFNEAVTLTKYLRAKQNNSNTEINYKILFLLLCEYKI